MLDVDHLNRTFPKYPVTIRDKGWVYGVWYCGTSFQKAEIYGQHPPTYMKRLRALFPSARRWLVCPSGVIADRDDTVCIDLVRRKEGRPDIQASADSIPLGDSTVDVVETDPPYGAEHEEIYGTGKYPRRKSMAEFRRVLRPGGYLCWLDVRYPMYKRKHWELVGLIGVITGFERVTRVLSIFRKMEETPTLFGERDDS